MTGNMVGFGYFGRLGLENAEGMMGNIAGGMERRMCRILLHFLFRLKIYGSIFCAMVGFIATVLVVWRFHCVWASTMPRLRFEALPLWFVLGGNLIENPWVSFL
jgi:hypothetical protein